MYSLKKTTTATLFPLKALFNCAEHVTVVCVRDVSNTHTHTVAQHNAVPAH